MKDTDKPKTIFFPSFSIEPGSVNTVPTVPTATKERTGLPPQMQNIPEGSLVRVSSGSYSDYTVDGVYRALKEIDPNLMIRGWLEAHPEQSEKYDFEYYHFLEWLVETGFLRPVDSIEWHLCDYSDSEEMSVY